MKSWRKIDWLKKINTTRLFWFFLIISFVLIIVIKFSPLKDIHTSEISILSWFHYGFELGETLFGLSISYIVSCIFYFIVVYLPEEKKRKRAMTIIENRIDSILGSMGVIIYYYYYKNGINEVDEDILREKVQKIKRIDPNHKMDFDYQYIEKTTGNTVPFNTGEYTELMLLAQNRNSIQQTINGIFQIPIIINVDHDLIVILEEINNCMFFKTTSAVENVGSGNTPEIGGELFKFHFLYKELGKYIEPTKYTFKQKK